MEAIIDYELKDFLALDDINMVADYVYILEFLKPLSEIDNPNYSGSTDIPIKLKIKKPSELRFCDVTNIRTYFNQANIEGIIESVKLCSDLTVNQILALTITKFYGIINYIKEDLIQLSNMEINELSENHFDINLESINANGRMARFGVLNTIDSLAGGDITKWDEIEKLPYMTVFTKLLMDKEKASIQRDLAEIQERKRKQQK